MVDKTFSYGIYDKKQELNLNHNEQKKKRENFSLNYKKNNRRSTFWLDTFLQSEDLEDQMNYLCFLILVFSIFMSVFYNIKIICTISILSIILICAFYYFIKNTYKIENYNIDTIEDFKRKKETVYKYNKTPIEELKKYHYTNLYSFHGDDLFSNQVQKHYKYKQILPFNLKRENNNINTEYKSNIPPLKTNILNNINKVNELLSKTPLLSLDQLNSNSILEQNYLNMKVDENEKKYNILPKDYENTNTPKINNYNFPSSFQPTSNIYSSDYSNIFLDNQILFRSHFENEMEKRNKLREEQLKIAPNRTLF